MCLITWDKTQWIWLWHDTIGMTMTTLVESITCNNMYLWGIGWTTSWTLWFAVHSIATSIRSLLWMFRYWNLGNLAKHNTLLHSEHVHCDQFEKVWQRFLRFTFTDPCYNTVFWDKWYGIMEFECHHQPSWVYISSLKICNITQTSCTRYQAIQKL